MTKVRVVGRCLEGVKVNGYVIEDATGKRIVISKEVMERMALNNEIKDVRAQIYNGRANLRGVGFKLVDLPKFDMRGVSLDEKEFKRLRGVYSLRAKILDGREVVGYVVQKIGDNGEYIEKKMKRDEVMQLASTGNIANVRVQKNRGGYIMRGVGKELSKLPSITLG